MCNIINKPKLLIYSDSHVYGGADRYLLLIAPVLLEDWDITYIYRSDVDFSALTGKLKQLGVSCLPLARDKFTLSNVMTLKKTFTDIRPDLIVFNQGSFYTSKDARLAAKLAKIPQVIIQHGSTFEGKKFYSISNRIFARLTFTASLKMIVPSKSSKQFFAKYFPYLDNIEVINHGIDLDKFNPARYNRVQARRQMHIPDSVPVLIFIGRLEEDKNPDMVLDLLKALDTPNTEVLFVGDGSQREKLEKRAKSIFSQQVKFLGTVPDAGVYLAVSDILIQPSRSESFSLAVVEAMAMGVVPVAFKIDSLPEIIGSGELVAPYGDIDAMKNIVANLIADTKHRAELSKFVQTRARKLFDIKRMQTETKKFFKEISKKLSN